MNKKSKSEDKTEFQKLYRRGHEAFVYENYQEAFDKFTKAKKLYNPVQDGLVTYTNMIIDEARIYRYMNDFKTAQVNLNERMEEIRRKYHNIQEDSELYLQKMEQEFKLISELAQLYATLAQNTNAQNKRDIYIQYIDKCVEYCSKALKLSAYVLLSNNKLKISSQEECEWQQYYSQAVISSIDPLIIQAQKLGQQSLSIFHLIYKVAQKMYKFYELSHKSKQVEKQNSRSYYYRGVMLKKTSKDFKQIEYFLKKDQQYCRRQNQKADLQKTRVQLFNFYISNWKFEEAKKLLVTDEKKKQFNQAQYLKNKQQVLRLEKLIMSNQFLNLDPPLQINNLQYLIEIYENFSWLARFIPVARVFLRNSSLQNNVVYYASFQAARTYFQMFDEINALNYCDKALKYCENGSNQHYQALFLKMQIYESLNTNKNVQKLKDIENQLLALAESLNDSQLKLKQVRQHIKNRKFNEGRIVVLQKKLLETQQEGLMFAFLKQSKEKYKIQTNIQNMSDSNPNQNADFQNNVEPQFSFLRQKGMPQQMHMISKSNSELLLQKYIKLCNQKDVIQRNFILEKIKSLQKQKQNIELDLNLFYQIPIKQLEIYLQICQSLRWDFRNFKPTNNFIEKFISVANIKGMKTLKMNEIHKLITIQTMYQLFKTSQELQQLHLERLDKKFVQYYTENCSKFTFELFFPYKLKILKLKNSKITDHFLSHISENFIQLEQLDLSMNQIKGYELSQLNKLKVLEKLNLSYNPLQIGTELCNKSIKKLKIKHVRKSGSELPQLIFPQIKFCKILDLSQNSSEMIQNILQNFHKYHMEEQILQFPFFEEIRLKKANLGTNQNSQLWHFLNLLLLLCINFKTLDLRFSHYDKSKFIMFNNYLHDSGKIFHTDVRAHIAEEYKNQ